MCCTPWTNKKAFIQFSEAREDEFLIKLNNSGALVSVCLAEFLDADRVSFGKRGFVSAFSRSGPGLWGCIKPDVVEYAGDFLREINGFLITQHNDTSAAVVKTGAGKTGFAVGTSFATPKVAHIVAQLAKKFPNDSTLLYKALVVQSARLQEHVFFHPNTLVMAYLINNAHLKIPLIVSLL